MLSFALFLVEDSNAPDLRSNWRLNCGRSTPANVYRCALVLSRVYLIVNQIYRKFSIVIRSPLKRRLVHSPFLVAQSKLETVFGFDLVMWFSRGD